MTGCNVVWTTPSKDSSGSMPLGNGDIGLNVWCEENGDLVLYVSKTDAWDENVRLLKLGRVRIRSSAGRSPFRQTLNVAKGQIEIRLGSIEWVIWVDAYNPVVRLQARSGSPFDLEVRVECWRTAVRTLASPEDHSACGLDEGPEPVVCRPDVVLPAWNHRLAWYHRNEKSAWAGSIRHQGLEAWMQRAPDPILHRTFGAAVAGRGLHAANSTTLKSAAPKSQFCVSIFPLTTQTVTVDEWIDQLDRQVTKLDSLDPDRTLTDHHRWWQNFWDRSWIRVSGFDRAETVNRGYALQRFINACGGRGGYPIKFNGSIFTVDAREEKEHFDADYRRWGGGYWSQNTRLIYWPMAACGDFDLMGSFFKMYREALPFAEFRTPAYYGHEGAFFPETMYFWGAYFNNNYGWDRDGKDISHIKNRYIRWYWSGGLELIAMGLEYFAFTRDADFARATLVPLARSILKFFDRHFPRTPQGKIVFTPSQCLETWHESVDPLPEIAGLRYVLDRLAAEPELPVSPEDRRDWERLRSELPELPMNTVNGRTVLAPARELIGPKMNCENPELYAVFPYRLFGVGRPDLALARRTFELRAVKCEAGWSQDPIQAALLGMADTAAKMVTDRFAPQHSSSRFPAFWGPNFDWIPDQDHGGVAMYALQAMILQSVGDDLLLLPAWPEGWNVDFKLHAPGRTVVRGQFENGTWKSVVAEPSSESHRLKKMR